MLFEIWLHNIRFSFIVWQKQYVVRVSCAHGQQIQVSHVRFRILFTKKLSKVTYILNRRNKSDGLLFILLLPRE
jgi:hypothetical protein